MAFLRNQEEFQQMKRLLQQNPGMLNALLQNIGQSNPELLQIISQNQEAFIRMINESDDGSTSGSGGTGSGSRSGSGRTPAAGEEHLGESGVIQVSPQDKEAIERVSFTNSKFQWWKKLLAVYSQIIIRSNVLRHHFYLPKVIMLVQTGLEYSAS